MLSEMGQSRKDRGTMRSHCCDVSGRATFVETEGRRVGTQGWGAWGLEFNGGRVPVWGRWKFPEAAQECEPFETTRVKLKWQNLRIFDHSENSYLQTCFKCHRLMPILEKFHHPDFFANFTSSA